MPHPPRAIVLTFDRLSRRCLSFYGHEWIEAPNLERLAARSVVFDQHFGIAAGPMDQSNESDPFWSRLREAGVDAVSLVEESVPQLSDSVDSAEGDAVDLETTPFAHLLAQADQTLTEFATQADASWLLWLKSAGIAWPCVATEEFAELYADELEGEQAEFLDEIKLAEIAYAACITQLDHLMGRLLATIDRLFPDGRPLLIVAALAGESLGESEPLPLEHVDTSPSPETWKLRDEMVHTLLMVSPPVAGSVGSRRQELVQSSDLWPTLLDWFPAGATQTQPVCVEQPVRRTGTLARSASDDEQDGQECPSDEPLESLMEFQSRSLLPLIRNEPFVCRESVFLRDDEGHAALRVRDFLLVERDAAELLRSARTTERADVTGFSCQLFLKPEDVWEINDIAEQHPEQVAVMRDVLRQWLP